MGMNTAKYGNENKWKIFCLLNGVRVGEIDASGKDQTDALKRAKRYFRRRKIEFDEIDFLDRIIKE